MRERLVAYLLNDLSAEERAAVEKQLAAEPELQQELEKLRECLSCCEEESVVEKPPQLASRTCDFVGHAIQKSKALCHHSTTGAKQLSESHDSFTSSKKWSLLDMGITAGIAVVLATLLAPMLLAKREDTRIYVCQDKMHQLGAALMDYSLRYHGKLPNIKPGENAGVFVVALADSGVLTREQLAQLVVCPSTPLADRVASGCVKIHIPTRGELVAVTGAHRDQLRRSMAGNYAYSLGYQNRQGKIHQVPFSGSRHVPLLADAPSFAIAGYQSANHGGCGQNVLFQDLSCRYCTQCKCQEKRDHWFLNDDGQPAAGRHENDIVLGASDATPVIEFVSR